MKSVKVIFLSCPPAQSYLEFSLIFDDGYEKHYVLRDYDLRQFRGASERDIIEEQARLYYESLDESVDYIKLIFL